MALSESVETSLREAEQSLRNALAYAARQEKPFVGKHIAEMIMEIDGLIAADQLMDKLESRMNGDDDLLVLLLYSRPQTRFCADVHASQPARSQPVLAKSRRSHENLELISDLVPAKHAPKLEEELLHELPFARRRELLRMQDIVLIEHLIDFQNNVKLFLCSRISTEHWSSKGSSVVLPDFHSLVAFRAASMDTISCSTSPSKERINQLTRRYLASSCSLGLLRKLADGTELLQLVEACSAQKLANLLVAQWLLLLLLG